MRVARIMHSSTLCSDAEKQEADDLELMKTMHGPLISFLLLATTWVSSNMWQPLFSVLMDLEQSSSGTLRLKSLDWILKDVPSGWTQPAGRLGYYSTNATTWRAQSMSTGCSPGRSERWGTWLYPSLRAAPSSDPAELPLPEARCWCSDSEW